MSTFLEIAEQPDKRFKVYRKGLEHGAGEGQLLAQDLPLTIAIRFAQKEETDDDSGICFEWQPIPGLESDEVIEAAIALLAPIRDRFSITQAEAEALPVEARVAAYANAHLVEPIDAIWWLCELGLQKRLELAMERGEEVPVYLWASYKALQSEMEEFKKREVLGGNPESHKE